MRFCFESKQFIELSIEENKSAIVASNRSLTWKEFHSEVQQFIAFFEENNFRNSAKPILLFGHKEAEMLIAMYACMCMNITYIPADVIYPKERIEKVTQIAEIEIIVNCTNIPLAFENITELTFTNTQLSKVNFPVNISKLAEPVSDPLIYILFTSGSTGEPKGVQISSEAIASFSRWMSADFGFTSTDIFFNTAVFSFDLSVFEIISFASLGATIVLNDKKTCENQEHLLNRLVETKASVWVSTPSFAFIFSRIMEDNRFQHLNYFLFCGEMLAHSLATTIKTKLPIVVLYNTYGPTEATVATTLVEITQDILQKYNPLPVGFPKRESTIDIDKETESSEYGEIIIVGAHVSMGYFKREELNTEKFFIKEEKRAFRTGDLGFFKDGMLFCSGRNDDQIKWNGFRIELNEITNSLLKLPNIKEAVTVALKRNNEVKKLVSFVILEEQKDKVSLNIELKAALAETLPYYMIPGDIDAVIEFPYNQNFKIDKNALTEAYLKRQFS